MTEGKNSGSILNSHGFTAIKGWDPATGWGTPDYAQLVKLV